MRPQVLLYNLRGTPKGELIRAYLKAAEIGAKDVAPSDYGKPLGELLGLPGFTEGSGKGKKTGAPVSSILLQPGFTDEMPVMFLFTEQQMNDFLQFFRNAEVPRVELKAVVTPTNINWDSRRLHEAITAEHMQIINDKRSKEKNKK